MDDDASKGVRRRGVKWGGKLSRRVWSTVEKEALLECLREIVRTGWKSDSGFRTGYLGVLEQLLNRSCSNNRLKAEPHISSKIHVWKKMYGCINDMMDRSGFSWNPTTNTIDVKDDAFDNFAKPEYYVPTPDPNLYGDDDEFMNSFASAPAPANVYRSEIERVSSRKRKMVATDIDKKFESFVNVTDCRLSDIANCFGIEAEESQARKQVWSVVDSINNLTIEDKCLISRKIVNNKADLDLFFTMSAETFIKILAVGKFWKAIVVVNSSY
ncbi:UNVERIFIED_CONTAM: hypothetical protein Sradi_0680600 [Sesamum radiatum]|uniref:Myb/SANT-like domain-containing protein n=1 Tax=Sesamum radiatum TaxID=300843 RepID=A0AAW2VQ36_SESRA